MPPTLHLENAMPAKPASEHVASCYAPTINGVPNRRHVEIRYDNQNRAAAGYVVTVISDTVAESSQRRASKAAALELAANLGYTEVV
jgi:hypothetical protein